MYCKLCNKHLYETLSFVTIFKWNYTLHIDCEKKHHIPDDFITFPHDDIMIDYTYLFEQGFEQSDTNYLYQNYYKKILEMYQNDGKWSVIFDLDDIIDQSDISLVFPLADRTMLLTSMFYELVLDTDKT